MDIKSVSGKVLFTVKGDTLYNANLSGANLSGIKVNELTKF